MSKGIANLTSIFFISIFTVFTLLGFISTLNRFSNFDRFYIFWQGMYLADSFIVKIYTNQTNSDLVIFNVPYQNNPSQVQEVGKAYLDNSNTIVSSTKPYKYQTRLIIQFSGEIEKYRIMLKYSE